jgi:hypothetical protein
MVIVELLVHDGHVLEQEDVDLSPDDGRSMYWTNT